MMYSLEFVEKSIRKENEAEMVIIGISKLQGGRTLLQSQKRVLLSVNHSAMR